MGDVVAESRLGLGTATFIAGYGLGQVASPAKPDDRLDLLRAALDAGIRYVDTSPDYADVERLLGCLAPEVARRQVRVCVKITAAQWAGGLEASLGRLGLPAVDSLMLHSSTAVHLEDGRIGEDFAPLKARGLIRRAGASTYGEDDAVLAIAQPWCDAVQIEHSILNPAVVAAVASRKHAGQELVVRSVLCKGLLTPRRHYLPGLETDVVEALDRLENLALAWGFGGLAELAIRFALDTPAVEVVLIGVATRTELATALAAAARPPLARDQMRALAGFDRSASAWTHPERWEALR